MRQPHKFPRLRCPQCGYEYTPTMHGWAFRTDDRTECIGIEGNGPLGHSFGHPFEVVDEAAPSNDS